MYDSLYAEPEKVRIYKTDMSEHHKLSKEAECIALDLMAYCDLCKNLLNIDEVRTVIINLMALD